MIDFKFFQKINAEVIMKYRKHIFDPAGGGKDAKDVYGKPYKTYSTYPSKWTSMSMRKSARGLIPKGGISYADAKKTGQLKRQDAKFGDSNAPVLSGDLYKDFQLIKIGSSGFTFGNLARQSTVKFLTEMGRVIMAENKALPTKVGKYVMAEADKYVKKELDKIKGGTFNI
jgi:hypothetical protein